MRFYKACSMTKVALTCVLMLILSGASQAYTIVLRSGERIEIPEIYSVTQTALTYEIAAGFYRTILLNVINFAATEMANNEAPGSFSLKSRNEAGVTGDQSHRPQSDKSQGAARPTLTNERIEASRRSNQASGQAYELQRRELPIISAEETERRAAEQLRRLQQLATEIEQQNGDTEAALSMQAQTLRYEFASVDAELDYYRARLAQATQPPSLVSLATPATTIAGIPPFAFPYTFGGIVVGHTPVFGGRVFGSPGIIAGRVNRTNVSRGTSFGINVSIGGGTRSGNVFGGNHRRHDGHGARPGRHYTYPYGYTYGNGFPFIGYTPVGDDVIELRSRVRELEAARAQLVARRRLLEDEARRAGVAPGALRQ